MNSNLHPEFEALFERFLLFCEKTYPEAVAEDYLTKLREEVGELHAEPNMEELVDCLLVLIGLSRFLPGNLKEALSEKISRNESRRWERQDDGAYRHVDP